MPVALDRDGASAARTADEIALLTERVEITGHIDEAALHKLYASARVFCLLSRCESFGIPAVEAQAFGTPAVVADGTAAPEIIGDGGRVVRQDDVPATAACLLELLTDEVEWSRRSAAACGNAGRFHWRDCSTPLVRAIEELAREFA